MIFRSITTQLQLWHCAVPSLMGIILLTTFYYYEKESLTRDLELELKSRITAMIPFADRVAKSSDHESFSKPSENSSTVENAPKEPRFPNLDSQVADAIDAGFFIRIFSQGNQLIWQSNNAPDLQLPETTNAQGITYMHTIEGYQEAVYAAPQSHTVTIGSSRKKLSKTLNLLRIQITCLTIALISMGWTIGYIITRRALRPLETISETARSISSGKRGQRINVDETKNELGTLAVVLNESFERQDAAFDQQVQFLADASHELRTPIAVILAKSQLGQMHTDQQRRTDALATCESAAKHMRDLIESLLDLSRLDSGAFTLQKSRGDLTTMIHEAIKFLQPLADEKGLTVQTDLASASCEFDHQRIRQVVINILSNAIKYNLPNEGWIKVISTNEADHFQLRIENSGKTISPGDLPYLFDRFYRADKSRTKSREGSAGLGLAITKAIVEAHGGGISAESVDGVTAVTVRLPLPSED